MNRKPKMSEVLTPALVSAVNAYLLARAAAETMRERVDAIERQILTESPIYADKADGRPILDGRELYLSSDEDAFQDYLIECDKRERAAGLKPADMPRDYCPALVLEDLQRKAERLIVETGGKPFGFTVDRLLCAGLDTYREFIDLTVRLVVNRPGFKNPLTGRRAA